MNRAADILEAPNYGMYEASVYLHVPVSTLRYWTIGMGTEPPLVRLASRKPRLLLSFKNLVECYVLEVIRRSHRIHPRKIRYSFETALKAYPSKHPFADYNLSTSSSGKIYLDDKELVDLSVGGQVVFRDILGGSLRRVEREQGVARRLYPYMRKAQITQAQVESPRVVVIDPDVSFGMPVLADSRISTSFLASRYRGGDSIPMLAKDYGRDEGEIEEALVWERAKQAA